jgi:hypothetical protein
MPLLDLDDDSVGRLRFREVLVHRALLARYVMGAQDAHMFVLECDFVVRVVDDGWIVLS